MADEVKGQETEINDLIQDYVPPMQDGGEPQTQTPTEVPNVEKREERPTETPSEQKPTDQPAAETQAPVEAQTPQAPKEQGQEQPQAQAPVQPQDQPPQKTELELMKEENARLLSRINELAQRVVGPTPAPAKTPEQIEAERQQAEQQARQVLAFLPSEEVFDEALKTKDNFNALLTKVMNVAVERSLRLMPQVAAGVAEQKITMINMVRDFFTDNKDLLQHRPYVGATSNEISAAHPDWSLSQVLEETEKVVRERLGVARVIGTAAEVQAQTQAQTGQVRTAVDTNPGFVPGGTGGRKGGSSSDGNLTPVEKDIMSLIS